MKPSCFSCKYLFVEKSEYLDGDDDTKELEFYCIQGDKRLRIYPPFKNICGKFEQKITDQCDKNLH